MELPEMIRRCQSDELESFEQLYRLYSRKAIGLAYNIAGSSSLAEDIVQETFLICYKEIKKVKNPETFHIWFYKILVRVAWRMVSKYKKAARLTESELSVDMPENMDVDYTVEIFNDRMVVREAVKNLKLALKTPVVLYYFNEMSTKEIAKIMGCYQGTVKSRLYKARELLMKELQPHFKTDLDFIGMEEGSRANG